jgi:hypothetical protein
MRNIQRVLTIAALALLAACGDDGTGASGDTLTQVEVAALMSTLGGSTSDLNVTNLPVDANGRFSLNTACPQGGRITSAGQVTERTQTRMVFDLSVEYQDCQQSSQAGVFKIDGSLREAGDFQFGQSLESFSMEMSLTGDFDWWLGDRAGSCDIDVEFSFAQNDYSVTGTICGESAISLN